MEQMNFNVFERVTLLGILPDPEGNYVTYKLLTTFKSDLSFSEEEIEVFGIEQLDGKITWNKSEDKEIGVGDQILKLIKEALKRLDEKGKINKNNAPIYERFMI
jgi:hypothetical protein